MGIMMHWVKCELTGRRLLEYRGAYRLRYKECFSFYALAAVLVVLSLLQYPVKLWYNRGL